MRLSPLAAVTLAVGLVTLTVACSGDDDASGPASTTTSSSTALTATSQAPPVASSTTTTSSTVPPISDADLEELAAALGVATLVVEDADGSSVLTWADGRPGRVAVPEATFTAWSDGSYIHWVTREPMEDGPDAVISFATTFDGTEVCRAPGEIRSVIPRDGGLYAAVIEFEYQVDDSVREWPYQRAFYDCDNSAEMHLDPVTWRHEGGWRSLLTVGDRTFQEVGDAEGNADVVNEDGVSVNGDDYAGSHEFSPDGSRVVYGDYGLGASPHTSRVIRLRDTVTGELLWSAEVDRPFNFLAHTDDRVLVAQPRQEHEFEPWKSMESVVVFDAITGEEIADVPAATMLLYSGP